MKKTGLLLFLVLILCVVFVSAEQYYKPEKVERRDVFSISSVMISSLSQLTGMNSLNVLSDYYITGAAGSKIGSDSKISKTSSKKRISPIKKESSKIKSSSSKIRDSKISKTSTSSKKRISPIKKESSKPKISAKKKIISDKITKKKAEIKMEREYPSSRSKKVSSKQYGKEPSKKIEQEKSRKIKSSEESLLKELSKVSRELSELEDIDINKLKIKSSEIERKKSREKESLLKKLTEVQDELSELEDIDINKLKIEETDRDIHTLGSMLQKEQGKIYTKESEKRIYVNDYLGEESEILERKRFSNKYLEDVRRQKYLEDRDILQSKRFEQESGRISEEERIKNSMFHSLRRFVALDDEAQLEGIYEIIDNSGRKGFVMKVKEKRKFLGFTIPWSSKERNFLISETGEYVGELA